MKKKAILAASLALALMASPFGGINVSAEEGENVSVQDESRAAAPVEKETLGHLAMSGSPRIWDGALFLFPLLISAPIRRIYGFIGTASWLGNTIPSAITVIRGTSM